MCSLCMWNEWFLFCFPFPASTLMRCQLERWCGAEQWVATTHPSPCLSMPPYGMDQLGLPPVADTRSTTAMRHSCLSSPISSSMAAPLILSSKHPPPANATTSQPQTMPPSHQSVASPWTISATTTWSILIAMTTSATPSPHQSVSYSPQRSAASETPATWSLEGTAVTTTQRGTVGQPPPTIRRWRECDAYNRHRERCIHRNYLRGGVRKFNWIILVCSFCSFMVS